MTLSRSRSSHGAPRSQPRQARESRGRRLVHRQDGGTRAGGVAETRRGAESAGTRPGASRLRHRSGARALRAARGADRGARLRGRRGAAHPARAAEADPKIRPAHRHAGPRARRRPAHSRARLRSGPRPQHVPSFPGRPRIFASARPVAEAGRADRQHRLPPARASRGPTGRSQDLARRLPCRRAGSRPRARRRARFPAVSIFPGAPAAMSLPKLELLYQAAVNGPGLSAELRAAYGSDLGFESPRVFANFVSSVDGVVALEERAESGGIISGGDPGDHFVMGLLRACADGVLVGAGTFRKAGPHLWYPERIFPEAAEQWAELRRNLGLAAHPRLVLLSASGNVDPTHPALRDGAIVIVSPRGEPRLRGRLPPNARLVVVEEDPISFAKVLAIAR